MNAIRIDRNQKNVFDLTHDVKMSAKFGYLYPTCAIECLPGEVHTCAAESLVRFDPLVFPVMHRFNIRHDWYFVPNRICWEHWEEFITNKVAPPGVQPVHPYLIVAADGSNYTTLMDQFGVPNPTAVAGASQNINIDAIPFMAYQKIWDTYYRQDFIIPDLESELGQKTLNDGSNGADQIFLAELRRVAWEHDYFTSCLPTPQHGAPVEIPIDINGDLPVRRNNAGGGSVSWNNDFGGGATNVDNEASTGGFIGADELFVPEGEVDNQTTIEDLRRASAIQRFFERLQRTGRRLKEVMLSAFGEDGGDGRLQRPEFIYSSEAPVVISEVLNTSDTANAPQGALAGHGVGVNSGGYGRYKTKEHGWLICVTSVVPKSAYQDGLPKYLAQKNSYTDYFWKEFANLGEEAVLNQEIFAYQATDGGTFGYLPRYSKYRTIQNRVCGQFRTTLDSLHFGRQFAGLPTLSEAFIECNPGKRIFANTNAADDELQIFILNKIRSVRPIPKFGTPYLQ